MYLTGRQRRIIADGVAKNLPTREIARRANTSLPTVHGYVLRVGLSKKDPRSFRIPVPPRVELLALLQKLNNEVVGEHYGVSESTVRKWRLRYGIVPFRRQKKKKPDLARTPTYTMLSEAEISKLLKGQRFEDMRSR